MQVRSRFVACMESNEYLGLMLRAVRQDATYSSQRQAWITPMLNARLFFQERLDECPAEFSSLNEAIEEGARRGLWEMDAATDVLLMK